MPRFRLLSGGDDASPPRPANGLRADDFPRADDPVTCELRALYSAPGDRYWDDFEGRIMAAVRAGGASRPARAAAEWWQALAEWARPGLAAAAVLVVVVGAITVQTHGTRATVARGATEIPGLELQPLDPELARAVDEASTDPVAAAAARAAQEAAYLLTGGLKRRAPVRLDVPPAQQAPARDVTPPGDEDDLQRARREATFRYVMPD
ncbi:MAG: hypothetical protein ACXW05_11560 [Gemmatirosa sp.]